MRLNVRGGHQGDRGTGIGTVARLAKALGLTAAVHRMVKRRRKKHDMKPTDQALQVYLGVTLISSGLGALMVMAGATGVLFGMGLLISGVIGFGLGLLAVQIGRVAEAMEDRQSSTKPPTG